MNETTLFIMIIGAFSLVVAFFYLKQQQQREEALVAQVQAQGANQYQVPQIMSASALSSGYSGIKT